MSEEVADLMKHLKFSEEESEDISPPRVIAEDDLFEMDKGIVAKIIGFKRVDCDAVLRFKSLSDKQAILKRTPWSFEGTLLALTHFDPTLSLEEFDFRPLAVWIDCTKPLRRCAKMGQLANGQPRKCLLKYERLPSFFHRCGIIGHVLTECPGFSEQLQQPLQFGEWLRVPTNKRTEEGSSRRREGIVYVEDKKNARTLTSSANNPLSERTGRVPQGGSWIPGRDLLYSSNSNQEDDLDSTDPTGPDSSLPRSFLNVFLIHELSREEEQQPNLDPSVRAEQIFRFTGFYGRSVWSDKKHKWDLIAHMASFSSFPWCMGGDFNEILHSNEKTGGRKKLRVHMEDFQRCLRGVDLWDIRPRIVETISTTNSDHSAISLSLKSDIHISSPRRDYFKFDACWANEDQCRHIVQQTWENNEDSFSNKVIKIEDKLGNWQQARRRQAKWDERRIRSRILHLDSGSISDENCSKNGPNKGADIKLDMEKAYDRVEWGFLLDGLFALFLKAQRRNEIKGIRASLRGLRIMHLLYADDSLLFVKNSNVELRRDKSILNQYEKASGQKESLRHWTRGTILVYLLQLGNENERRSTLSKIRRRRGSRDGLSDSSLLEEDKKQNSRGWAMVAWYKVYRSKKFGGMGFRDLRLFNIVLVGNQVWRLIQDENSLAFKVLKAKYFPNSSFIEAKLGDRHSYAWASLMKAKEALLDGFFWRVGIYSKARMFEDKWGDSSVVQWRERYMDRIDQPVRVADFMIPGCARWDVQKVNRVLLTEDASQVLNILITPVQGDKMLWSHHSSGSYSTKSGYNWLTIQNSPTLIAEVIWNAVAKANVLPKIKIFGWRLFHEAIPSSGHCGSGYAWNGPWGVAKKINPLFTSKSTEAAAFTQGIHFAQEIGWHNVIIECDAISIVYRLSNTNSNKTQDISIVRLLLNETRLSLADHPFFKVHYVCREANRVAHSLAQWALSNDNPVWFFLDEPLEVMDRVRDLASKKAAVIFTKSSCYMCYSIKTLFYELGASPAIHELDHDPSGREMDRALRGLGCDPSVPAVFIGGRFVGSAKDVISLHVDGSLKQMLIDAKAIWF
ncbi:hypothetical protein F3Y22_tig00111311pilonHSYRG00100 [Hibiscus syriacus]|uniref:Uncharacterized protein n=2 Tax=Hibiscus syriacus TaxID=106335 RepID=A0A6A2YQF1_HIBSY|nr:hypothetical protein F3Y22_tig00111311pilonHSYRG00100 [Hibiscus syriacus]